MTKPGDVEYGARVACYRIITDPSKPYYKPGSVTLSLFPLAMRMAGPVEAVWHALIRRNYGVSHFIVGRDHAGVKSSKNEDFYDPLGAQALVRFYEPEIGVELVDFPKMVFNKVKGVYMPETEVDPKDVGDISGTKFRQMLNSGAEIPEWFSDPDVVASLRLAYPPMRKRGVVLFFTGLSGSGKTTVAHALEPALRQFPDRHVSMLDGDVARTHLSKGLGFTKEDRITNVERMGFVAAQAARCSVVIVSAIAPYEQSRVTARRLVEESGAVFIEIFMSATFEQCAERDPKGLYKKVAAGQLKGFTGADDPFEVPTNPDITIDADTEVPDAVNIILEHMRSLDLLPEEVPVPMLAADK
eukprot:a845035_27.p2 GENE.a845035_27~~a845035_27.p2  ORF type:complete len:418 (+),score=211.37 a845035_27:185-1255(+)